MRAEEETAAQVLSFVFGIVNDVAALTKVEIKGNCLWTPIG